MKYLLKRADGGVSIMTLTPGAKVKDEIKKLDFEVISHKKLNAGYIPQSRNYRAAWTLKNNKIDIDLAKAKIVHRSLIIKSAHERAPTNDFSQKDFTNIETELSKLDIDNATNMNSLYNMWPKSIDMRTEYREHKIFEEQ